MFKRQEGVPFLDIECLFFKLVFDNYGILEDLSSFENAERGALKTFVSSIKAATKDFEAFVSKYYMKINLKYNFPYGMGLGSSASFNVALAAAVYTVARKLVGESNKDMSDLDFKFDQKWMIRNIANEGETAAHKTVSGIETTIISLGGIYKYCKF